MPANHADLKKFAQSARRQLREQVAARLEQVLKTDSAELREKDAARYELSQQLALTPKEVVIDRVAYTWFNRFCALRFMDVNRYNRIGVVSPTEGFTQPEILQEAKQCYIDEDLHPFVDCQAVFDLLNGRRPSSDQQQEAYRLLLVGVCNSLNRVMPFLFEKIADYTELLMPQDLLSEHSILHALREAMTPEACQDVEVIGWLYQFYISERKDEVFEALKKNQKIAPEDIPAATQLFTPHWIVRYLVENSLGRLWMLNRPNSSLVQMMDYFIRPEEPETDFLRVDSPEEIKICDPACGSGHMLAYAFDLLCAIYEEEGYPAVEIPRLILEKNLYGIEIDERAGALAAFALAMKARGRDRRFFSRGVQPNICVLENITFTDQELQEYAAEIGRDLFTEPLLQTLKQFELAKNFGSLIRPVLTDITFLRDELERKQIGASIFLYSVHERVLQAMNQAEYLNPRYHIVIANPPYMGGGGMNDDIKEFTREIYLSGSADLYGCFIERCLNLVFQKGVVGMITIPNWMFLSSFEELRKYIVQSNRICSLIQNGRGVWGSDFGSCAFVIKKSREKNFTGYYKKLFLEQGKVNSNSTLESRYFDNDSFILFKVINERFLEIPGIPIAFWISDRIREVFKESVPLDKVATVCVGLQTGDNDNFVRSWYEVNRKLTGLNIRSREEAKASEYKWFPYNKGGGYKKWYGNQQFVVNWHNDGEEIISLKPRSVIRNPETYFKSSLSWSKVTIGNFSLRLFPNGFIYDVAGCSIFPISERLGKIILALLNSPIMSDAITSLSPTVNYEVGQISKFPILLPDNTTQDEISDGVERIVRISKDDWDSNEISWNFSYHPIVDLRHINKLSEAYFLLSNNRNLTVSEVRNLEENNNRIILQTYQLQEELSSDVPFGEITLTCNPRYRYGGNRSEDELEALLLADTMREFISYAVGCMFGRYSLDKPGLILANQGETLQDYLRQVPNPTFVSDEDNAIPVLDGEWFSDDITERFKKFLRVTFGEEHYEENLAFIEQAIGRDIRSYFLKDFYSQHVKKYQKRPIYWMFSSPKGSFNVLIYMHRYKPDTISVILNRYLREFRAKLEARKGYLEQISINTSASQREKTAALKEIEGLKKMLEEIREYEWDILYPLAVQGIEIDLDDGVKVNYNKFGKALAKVSGLSQ